jgi:hypothetical protein
MQQMYALIYRLNLFINKKKINQIKLIEQFNKNKIECGVGHVQRFIKKKFLKN